MGVRKLHRDRSVAWVSRWWRRCGLLSQRRVRTRCPGRRHRRRPARWVRAPAPGCAGGVDPARVGGAAGQGGERQAPVPPPAVRTCRPERRCRRRSARRRRAPAPRFTSRVDPAGGWQSALRWAKVWPPATAAGAHSVAWSSVPSPTCPSASVPQHQAAPVVSIAQVWESPALRMGEGVVVSHGDRCVLVGLTGAAVAHLPIWVPAPAPGCAGGVDPARVGAAGAQVGEGVVVGHGHRGVLVGLAGVAVADLAVQVEAPAPGGTSGVDPARVRQAGAQVGEGVVVGHGDRGVLVGLEALPSPI